MEAQNDRLTKYAEFQGMEVVKVYCDAGKSGKNITGKIEAVYGNQITGNQIYKILVHFEKMYYKMTDLEKKEFMKDFINSIELYPEKKDNGSIVKQINLKFGVYYGGQETMDIRLLNEKTVEKCVLLSHKNAGNKLTGIR